MSLKAKLPEFNFSASYMYSVDTKMYLLFSVLLLSLAYPQGNKFTNEIFSCLTGYWFQLNFTLMIIWKYFTACAWRAWNINATIALAINILILQIIAHLACLWILIPWVTGLVSIIYFPSVMLFWCPITYKIIHMHCTCNTSCSSTLYCITV